MTGDPAALVGRQNESAAVAAALDGGPTAVLLTGDAGVGKTAIWEAVISERRSAGEHLLLSRTSAAEARLPWVGLTDLLRSVSPELLNALPEPQHRALASVLLQTAGAETLDERTVSTALLSTLTLLADTAPVLLAIDDLPYLDASSAAAVAFALRRLDRAHPARLIATVRGHNPDSPVLHGLSTERIPVGPMSLGALFELVQARRGIRFARPLLLRVYDTSGGNPLYALELARALERREISPAAGGPLPVPAGLGALVEERVRSLPADVVEVVAATAASWRFLATAGDSGAIELAAAAGMVVLDETLTQQVVVRAAHPLLSAAAYDSLSGARRRDLHSRLAAAADDPVERVRHAALAATEPRAELADELDAGVTAALAAGVADIAAVLAQQAVHHTCDPALLPRRLDRLAETQLRAGDSLAAQQTQQLAVESTPPGPERARRRVQLAVYTTEVTGWHDAETQLHGALEEAEADPRVLAEALMTLSAVTPDIELGEASAERALALLEKQSDPDHALLAGALAQVAGTRFRAGTGLDHELFERAIELERSNPFRRLSDRADASYAALLKYADELDRSEEMLLALRAEAQGIADVSSLAYATGHLVQIHLWQGRLAVARAYADEQVQVAVLAELGEQATRARYNLVQAMSFQGQLEDCESLCAALLAQPSLGDWVRHRVRATLGFVALSRNDAVAAARHLDAWHDAMTEMHFGEPGYSRSHFDYLTALIGAGRTDDAETFCLEVAGQAERSGRRSAGVVALTGRALLDAAAGEVESARAQMEPVLAWYETSPLRFDRARTLLIAGQIHRRAKAKASARALIDEAHQQFTEFGATAWQALAVAELARVNIRPSAPASLTETERQVAEFAAAGLTNREVADRTFLAVKTVEANLARVYRKLGIRSRAELGVRMGRLALSSEP